MLLGVTRGSDVRLGALLLAGVTKSAAVPCPVEDVDAGRQGRGPKHEVRIPNDEYRVKAADTVEDTDGA